MPDRNGSSNSPLSSQALEFSLAGLDLARGQPSDRFRRLAACLPTGQGATRGRDSVQAAYSAIRESNTPFGPAAYHVLHETSLRMSCRAGADTSRP